MTVSLRQSRWLTLGFPFLLFIASVAVIGVAIDRSIETRRFELQSKATLLEIQRALQDYHVAEEIYPRQTPMSGAALVQLLLETGHLDSPPRNPWSGEAYLPDSPEQPDGIEYRTDELAETYALRSLDGTLDTDAALWQLDSTEHHSLE